MPFRRTPSWRSKGDRPLKKWLAPVLGRQMAYFQAGEGDPILFLHGGPAASYLWRKVIPHLSQEAWCLAIDLMGTGDSDRLVPSGPHSYQMEDHSGYLDAFCEVLKLERVVLVVHGWASMAGFDWAARNPERVRAVAHLESIVRPMAWGDLQPETEQLLRQVRSSHGERFLLESDDYLERALRLEVMTPLHGIVLDEYLRGLGDDPEERRCLLNALQTIPISGHPVAGKEMVLHYADWLRRTEVPKLLIRGEPGYWLVGRALKSAMALSNQAVNSVRGTHLLPEDSPDGVGVFLAAWYRKLARREGRTLRST